MADTTEPRDSDMTAPIGSRPTDGAPATPDAAHASSPAGAAAAGGPGDPAGIPAPSPATAAPITAGGTTPPPVDPEPASGRGWRDRVRGAGRRTLLGGAAAALALLLLGGAGGFTLARVADDGPGSGPGIGWHDRDADDRGAPGGMFGPGGGPGGVLPPGVREEESESDEDAPTT